MKDDNSQRLAFFEICIAVFLFVAIAVICLLCFTKAHILQQESAEETNCIMIMENAAETFLSASDEDDIVNKFTNEFDAVIENNQITYQTGEYTVYVNTGVENDMLTGVIIIYEGDSHVYQMPVVKALGEIE